MYSGQKSRPNRLRTSGFTLVEVMVALVVIAIGMLGIAKMQALTLSNTGASRTRALAAIEAASLAAAMHANRAFWASYLLNVPGTHSVASGTGTVTSTSATMPTALTAAKGTLCPTNALSNANLSCYCASATSSPCLAAPVNMAASDLYDWGKGLASLLPAATATVVCTNTNSPVDCIITIQWTENAVALTTQEAKLASPAAIQNVQYKLYVIP
jgi:type IV pilus assembly protein PilV